MYPNRFNRNVVPDNSFQQSRVPTLASARDVSVDLNQVPTRKTARYVFSLFRSSLYELGISLFKENGGDWVDIYQPGRSSFLD